MIISFHDLISKLPPLKQEAPFLKILIVMHASWNNNFDFPRSLLHHQQHPPHTSMLIINHQCP